MASALHQKNKIFAIRLLPAVAACLLALTCAFSYADAQSEQKNLDPLEGMNRKVHNVNVALDLVLLRPAAKIARAVTPKPVREGVGNVFRNIGEIPSGANKLLQGKPRAFMRGALRFLVNSTMGVFGIFDVASRIGLQREYEDFGQTLAVWGVPPGPYIVLPFFGPSTIRDGFGRAADIAFNPLTFTSLDGRQQIILRGTEIVNQRISLLSFEFAISGNEYEFFRNSYLQRREHLIEDGEAEDSFLDDEF